MTYFPNEFKSFVATCEKISAYKFMHVFSGCIIRYVQIPGLISQLGHTFEIIVLCYGDNENMHAYLLTGVVDNYKFNNC